MSNEIKLKVRIRLDEKWASNHGGDDLVEYLEHSLNTALGFRGQVEGLKVVTR
jgi:hypothetical protein